MNNQIVGNLSDPNLSTRLRRLEQHVLNGNTPAEIMLTEDVTGQIDVSAADINELEELTVTDLFKTPTYPTEDDIPPLDVGQIVTVEGEGIYVEV